MKIKRLLVWIIIILLLIGGGFLLYKKFSATESESKPTEDEKKPENGKLTEKEIEEYLLEKRLDLQKYFVFNLGEELVKRGQKNYSYYNTCRVKSELSRDLTKLASLYVGKLIKKGYKIKPGNPLSKEIVSFVNQDFSAINDNEWKNENINKQIENGKNKYVIFEKDDEFENVFFGDKETDSQGQIWYKYSNRIYLRIKHSAIHICESKERALELIKTDPALKNRI